MQFQLKLLPADPSGKLVLPLSHHHMIQGLIYHLLYSDVNFSTFLHDQGFDDAGKSFKLFTFSLLDGKHSVKSPYITFYDTISLEIRSANEDFCNVLYEALMQTDQIELNHQPLIIVSAELKNVMVQKKKIKINTLSPITVYETIQQNGRPYTKYYDPLDKEFNMLLNKNFESKYYAATGESPREGIQLQVLSISSKDKYVTKFKGQTYITAWHGTFELRGLPDHLTFLYNTGLGAKNSQGFGTFSIS